MKVFFQVICCLLFALPLQAEYFVIKTYDVQIKVNSEAYFDVIETIQVEFTEPRRGIYRNVPYRYFKDGEDIKVQIKNVKVDDWKSKVTFSGGQMTIRIGDKDIFVEGPQKYVIRYRVYEAFTWAENHTEFYWNMTGSQWEVPIEEIAFSIEFPEGTNLRPDEYTIYTGALGATDQNAKIDFRGRNLFGKTTNPLGPNEGLTVAAKLPKELVPEITAFAKFWKNNNLMGIPAALLALLFGFWWKNGKNSNLVISSEPVYYPPQGYSPAEMGVLIDGRANNRDIISLLPWWAEQGYIKISNRPLDHPDGLDMRLEKLKKLGSDTPVYQHSVFDKLFDKGDTVYLNEFTNLFYGTMYTAGGQIKDFLKKHELYDRSSYRIFHSGWMIALGIIGFFVGILSIIFLSQIVAGIGLIVLGILAFILHFTNPKLSDYGRELMTQLKSFHKTVKEPNRDTITSILEKDPKYFEHVFPYAVAFGLDQSWTKKTKGLFMSPSWYHYYGYGSGHYSGANSTPSFQSFTEGFQPKSIQQVFTSAPAGTSSGGSGGGGSFGGGGSSGGGFGGGGGGSW